MRDLEGSRMAAAQTGQSRRIIARRLGPKLGERSKSGGNGQAVPLKKSRREILSGIVTNPPLNSGTA